MSSGPSAARIRASIVWSESISSIIQRYSSNRATHLLRQTNDVGIGLARKSVVCARLELGKLHRCRRSARSIADIVAVALFQISVQRSRTPRTLVRAQRFFLDFVAVYKWLS